jgi:amidophosphoribosyltransferase
MMTADALIAARDPRGFRPLSLGRLDGAWVFASETCALDLIGATHERDIEPGEVVVIRRGRLRSLRPFRAERSTFCIFEHIYFARPDSNLNGHNVYDRRSSAARSRASIRCRPTSWCPVLTRAIPRRSASPRKRASPTSRR